MGLIYAIATIVIGYFVYRVANQSHKQPSLKDLEARGDMLYTEIVDYERSLLKKAEEVLSRKDEPAFSRKLIKDQIEVYKDTVSLYRLVNDKYVTLRERFIHEPMDKRLTIAQDWADYVTARHRMNIELKNYFDSFTYYLTAPRDERERETEKRDKQLEAWRIKSSEIMRRFDKLLTE